MLPYKTLIPLDKEQDIPLYLQITHGLRRQIQAGIIHPGTKLPGTRVLAELLAVHRKTVVHAIDELEAQGWVEVKAYRGVFVVEQLPQVKHRPLAVKRLASDGPRQRVGFEFKPRPFLGPAREITQPLAFTDGYPDVRLAPINELATAYARTLRNTPPRELLNYHDARGPERLRKVLAREFNRNRGLSLGADNIMITRGSQMAIYLAAQVLLRPGDTVIVGETSYLSANLCFQTLGATLLRIPVDDHGLCVEEIAAICKKGKKIKALYVTSHHHHPTTVSLSPERRLRLLDLASEYGFAIIEDDYSYDFHYNNSPILPLASADRGGMVVYIGSFSKATAPAFRVGYIMAPTEVVEELVNFRRFVDRQGDTILELSIADLLENGTIQRFRKKALRQYRQRRDLFSELLRSELGEWVSFREPEGGMAAWVRFDPKFALAKVADLADQEGLYLSNGLHHNPPGQELNATRMGFAATDEEEMREGVAILRKLLKTF